MERGDRCTFVAGVSAGLRTVEAPGQQYYRKDFYTMAK